MRGNAERMTRKAKGLNDRNTFFICDTDERRSRLEENLRLSSLILAYSRLMGEKCSWPSLGFRRFASFPKRLRTGTSALRTAGVLARSGSGAPPRMGDHRGGLEGLPPGVRASILYRWGASQTRMPLNATIHQKTGGASRRTL
jgi:hypothetical protein